MDEERRRDVVHPPFLNIPDDHHVTLADVWPRSTDPDLALCPSLAQPEAFSGRCRTRLPADCRGPGVLSTSLPLTACHARLLELAGRNVWRLVMLAQYHQTVPLSFYEVTHVHTPGACGYIYGYTTRQQTDVTIKMAETMTELTTRRRFKSLRSFAALLPNISLVSSDWLIGDRPFCGRQTRRIFLHMRTSSYAHAHVWVTKNMVITEYR